MSAIIPSYYNLLSNAVQTSFLMVTPYKLILPCPSLVSFCLPICSFIYSYIQYFSSADTVPGFEEDTKMHETRNFQMA